MKFSRLVAILSAISCAAAAIHVESNIERREVDDAAAGADGIISLVMLVEELASNQHNAYVYCLSSLKGYRRLITIGSRILPWIMKCAIFI
jgi:hypothetical protein